MLLDQSRKSRNHVYSLKVLEPNSLTTTLLGKFSSHFKDECLKVFIEKYKCQMSFCSKKQLKLQYNFV